MKKNIQIFSIYFLLVNSISLSFTTAFAQDLKLLDWEPKSQMVVNETKIMKPKFPVIDIHNHLRDLEKAEYYLQQMDEAGVWICIGLDGRSKDDFYKEHLKASHSVSKERFHIYFSLISVK